jgi:hypothetical protein
MPGARRTVTERSVFELAPVVDGGSVYATRAFIESSRTAGVAGWIEFRLNAPGEPAVSTDHYEFDSKAAFGRWARDVESDLLAAELSGALSRWKRSQPFQPTLLKTADPVRDAAGSIYDPRIFCEKDGHLWVAWLEFEPFPDGPVLVTGHETSQPALAAVAYWVQGLEPLYYHGALERARWWSSLDDIERERSEAPGRMRKTADGAT